jgi:hypothetical protein
MDMGMVLQGSSPSVKDAEETRQVGADVMGIGGEFFNRFRGGLKQCGVSGALVFSDEGAQLFWDRKSDEKMVRGELALELFLKPLSGFVLLTGRAVAITAGAIELVGLAALFALVKRQAAAFGATGNHRMDNFAVCFGHAVAVVLEVLGAERAKDVIDGVHGRVPPSRD